MCISTTEALHIIKILLSDDIDACCEASMDKNEVSTKLHKLKKYLEYIVPFLLLTFVPLLIFVSRC